jgi:membrane protein YqaA with SNARE-associated domain
MAVLAPLGGIKVILLVALLDASILGIPVDPLFAYYVAQNPRRLIVYALMAALGSAFGSTLPYLIGYKGGEALVAKKLGEQRFARLHALSEKYGDWALIIPAIMPIGFPFKPFVFMAGVTEMRYPHFLLSIVVGRLLRFVILGLLILAYGPEILTFLLTSLQHHRGLTFTVIAAIVAGFALIVRASNSRMTQGVETSLA